MQHEPKKILFVEDDAVFRQRLSKSFRSRGYEVLEAESVDVARDFMREESPTLALFDLCVGPDSSLPLIQEFHDSCAGGVCVVLTGYGTITTAVSALKYGAANYLTKPVHVGEVLSAFGLDTEDSPNLEAESGDVSPTLMQVEWEHIQRVLDDCEGNVTHAATKLGVHRRTLQRKLSKIPTPLK